MAVITEQTPAEVFTSVRTNRLAFESAESRSPVPFDDRAGGIASGSHTVTVADAGAGQVVIPTGLNTISSIVNMEYLTSAGVRKTSGDETITFSGGDLTVVDGLNALAAGDVIHWSVRGK